MLEELYVIASVQLKKLLLVQNNFRILTVDSNDKECVTFSQESYSFLKKMKRYILHMPEESTLGTLM